MMFDLPDPTTLHARHGRGRGGSKHVTPEHIVTARTNPRQWVRLDDRYWANGSTWPHDVRNGKFQYLGGMNEWWECYYRPVEPVKTDGEGRILYEVYLAYLGPRT